MAPNQYHLLKTKRFLPLFITQFFNAFNDNVFKNALVILITYRLAQSASSEQFMIALTGGIFILPFFLFSATAGQIADKFEKSALIRLIKCAEVLFMIIAAFGFYLDNITLLMATLFFLGTHSTFFGPIKYSILPEQLRSDELIAGNGLIEAGTFLAILIGQILGGILIIGKNGVHLISFALLSIAVLGLASSLFIPRTRRGSPKLKISLNLFRETGRIMAMSKQQSTVFLAILGISWFWFIGATFITQFPTYTKDILQGSPAIFTLFLTVFSVGIGIGSLLCNKLLKGQISAKYVPVSILCMSIFIIDLFFATPQAALNSTHLLSLIEFLKSGNHFRILIDVFLMTVCGGLYIVPLYALMQKRTRESIRSRIIASNNIINALFMVASSLFVIIFTYLKFTIPQLFLIMAIANFFVAIYACKLLPDAVIHSFLKWLLKLLYRVEVKGLENYENAGKRLIIVANHTSFLDAALLAAFIPKKLIFAVNTQTAQKWWLRIVSKITHTFKLDPTNPLAVKSLIKEVRKNQQCVIFPEGRITVTGSLMKIYEGPGMIADAAKAPILPVRINGAQYTHFSRLKSKVKIRWFPKITITLLPPCRFTLEPTAKGRVRRHLLGKQLYDVMSHMMFESSDLETTLFQSLLDARRIHPLNHAILEDIQRKPMTYNQLIKASFVLGVHWQKLFKEEKNIGILLPNTISHVVTFFSLLTISYTPVMLNYTFGAKDLIQACRTSGVRHLITSTLFIDKAKLHDVIQELAANGIVIHFLEETKERLTWSTKLYGKLKDLFPFYFYQSNGKADQPAVILFTSGSEGKAKGVVLSHRNIQANRFQLSSVIDFTAQDIIFNAMPMFHSFGLNAGTLLPVLFGMKTFLYPSPLHYRVVPEYIYDLNATVTFGTDTFLRNYARFANPFDFYSVRYVVAGAEKLKEDTRQLWIDKFGIRILEGYGATETAPVLSVNTPMHYKVGTVGQFLPGIEYRIEALPGTKIGGRLHVRGPNVMHGYYFADQPLKLHPLPNGWYDTGDIIDVDSEGYITILGRAKRFAKIAGEMISLTAVENFITELWPSQQHAVISLPDPQKGEQLVLITSQPQATRQELLAFAKQKGFAELQVPKKIIYMNILPLLGTGKINYVELQANLLDNATPVANIRQQES
jgi:acyl-[acyl-carrier-protein]-phospholipid O-acyltransferase/long-chain-fatty-acid--[acyl-carrier-protein] ligase